MNSKDVFLYVVYFYHVHFCWLRCYVLIMFFDNSINNVCKYMACNPQIMCIIVATSGISSGVSGVIFLLYVYDGLYCTNSSCIHILQKKCCHNVVLLCCKVPVVCSLCQFNIRFSSFWNLLQCRVRNLLICTKFHQNRMIFRQDMAFSVFQNGGRPPSWIFKIYSFWSRDFQ